MHTLSRWAALIVLLALLAPAPILGGCGGGGGTSGGSVSGTSSAVSSNSSAADTTSTTVVNSPSPGVSLTTSPSPSPSPGGTATPSPTPYGPAGAHVLSGKIADERGAGLSDVAIAAQPLNAPAKVDGKTVYSAAPAPPLSTQTGADGSYNLPGFNTGQYYALSIERFDRKTLRTVFRFAPDSSDQSILLIAPKGTGLVEFELPSQRKLAASSLGTDVIVTWDTSTNPGFTNYTLYRASEANLGLTATPVNTLQSPTDVRYPDTWYTDRKVASPPLTYYRIYEKVFLPELGTFVLMGSNEVAVTFPQVVIAPSDKASEIGTATPITLQFSTVMDQASVAGALAVTSHGDTDETLTGTTSWTGNTLTFTPSTPLKLARVVTARLSGARDAAGNTIANVASTFTVSSGYTSSPNWYSGTLSAPIESIQVDPTGFIVFAYTRSTGTGLSLRKIAEIRSLAGFQGMGSDGSLTLTFPSPSPTAFPTPTPSPVTTRLDLVDESGNLWIAGTDEYGGGTVASGFTSATPGTRVGYIDDRSEGTQAVSLNPAPMADITGTYYNSGWMYNGGNPIMYSSIDDVSAADAAKVVVGMYMQPNAYSSSPAQITAIAPDPPRTTYSLTLNGGSAGNSPRFVSLPVGMISIAYGVTSSPVTIGAPWNLNAGAITVYPSSGGGTPFYRSAPYIGHPIVPPGARGTLAGQYGKPSGLALDTAGNIYIADRDNARVVVFNSLSVVPHSGTPPYPGYLGSFGSPGSGGFKRFAANGMGQIVVDKDHYVYVVDSGNGLVQMFAGVGVTGHQLGDFITQFPYGGASGVGTPMCIDRSGNLYSVGYNASTNMNTNITRTTRNPNP